MITLLALRPYFHLYRNHLLVGTIVALNILDVVLTKAIINKGGVEVNPLMANLMGGNGWIAIKAIVVVIYASVLWHLLQKGSNLAMRIAVVSLILYTVVVGWNAAVLTLS